jgi:alanine racemase
MEYPMITAHIDLDAIGKNVRNLKTLTIQPCRFMAVVKANAYGHGTLQVAQKALESGADWLGVARFHEALELREADIRAPILVFGYTPPTLTAQALSLNITLTVYDLESALHLSQAASSMARPLNVHLKVDTGMGRMGLIVKNSADHMSEADIDKQTAIEIIKEIQDIAKLPGLSLSGIYTHFAAADSLDPNYTKLQIRIFDELLSKLKQNDISFDICHAANSAGIIGFPQAHYDMVRAGISIYGLYPSAEVDHSRVKLFPAMTLKSMITSVRKVNKGFFVSYGMTYETKKPTILATVPIGYADGFSRKFSSSSSGGTMLVRGQHAPIAGRVCMDQTVLDVGHIPGVSRGDEVIIIGTQGSETLGADELANRIGTINYEIVSALTTRVTRIYTSNPPSKKYL